MNLREFKGPIGILAVSMFLNFTGFTIIIPVVPFLVSRFVPAPRVALMVGLITSVYALCQFSAAPFLGALSDRYGRRPILLVSLVGSVVGYIVFGLGGALAVLFAGRVIDGLTGGNVSTLFAYVADVTPPRGRGQVYGLLGAAGGFGFIVGPALGGLTSRYSLSAPVYLAALLTMANVLWAYWALPESLPPERRTADFGWRHLNPLAPLGQVLDAPLLRTLLASAFLFFLAGTMLQGSFSVFLKDRLGFGPGGIGLLLLIVGVMDVVSQGFLTGRLLPRLGESLLARIGLAINAAGLLLIAAVGVAPSLPLLGAAIVVFVLGDGLFQPAINGLIANAAPPDRQGRVQGANQSQQAVARTVGPALGAALYGLSAPLPYAAGALVVVLALTLLLPLTKTESRDGRPGAGNGAIPDV